MDFHAGHAPCITYPLTQHVLSFTHSLTPTHSLIPCHRYVTAPEFSHHSVVMDLHWLPGVEVSTRGKMSAAAEGTRDCAFFATTGGDGKVRGSLSCVCYVCSVSV